MFIYGVTTSTSLLYKEEEAFILSQNNSYHKGCSTKGLRRFIYAGYTNNSGNAWKTNNNWAAGKNFVEKLKEEK